MDSLRCPACGVEYAMAEPVWRCVCGSPLDIHFHAAFDLPAISTRRPTMWRYLEAIPIRDHDSLVSFEEGYTPLIEARFGGRKVLVKQDHLFPSGSFKDRGASVLVTKIKEMGITEVVEDSSGNAGSALAAYCARAGVRCRIFVPERANPVKVAQIVRYGADVVIVPGGREGAAEAALDAAEASYYASHAWNPFFIHGTKTCAYEVCEQLGWQAPDSVIMPVGNGTLFLGMHTGFDDLLASGIVNRLPKLIAVQAETCAPLHRAVKAGLDEAGRAGWGETIAEGIAVRKPVRYEQIVTAISHTCGDVLTVSDPEIAAALDVMNRLGFCIEPTSAAGIAGLEKYLPSCAPEEVIVAVLTGHGLKVHTTSPAQ